MAEGPSLAVWVAGVFFRKRRPPEKILILGANF
jgi:hypothetical protein